MILGYSKKGDRVLDMTSGTAATAVAGIHILICICANLLICLALCVNRTAMCIEMEEACHWEASSRLYWFIQKLQDKGQTLGAVDPNVALSLCCDLTPQVAREVVCPLGGPSNYPNGERPASLEAALASMDHLAVQPSTVEGKGCFAKAAFEQGEEIGPYWGQWVPVQSMKYRKLKQAGCTRLMRLRDTRMAGWVLVGDDRCPTTYVNENTQEDRINCMFDEADLDTLTPFTTHKAVMLKATKPITMGAELFAKYNCVEDEDSASDDSESNEGDTSPNDGIHAFFSTLSIFLKYYRTRMKK